MARNPELDRLRAEVIKRHIAATKKVSRLYRQAGVDLGGTEYDPRIATRDDIRKMNSRQAAAHLNRLNKFTSRANGFVAGAQGAPIPRSRWKSYKQVEAKNRELGAKHFSKFANLPMPGKGAQTIGEMREQLSPKGFKAVGFNKGNKLFIDGERKPGGLKNVQALDALITKMKKANQPKSVKEKIALARSNMLETLEGGGVSPEMVERVKRLSDYQVDALWNENPLFAREASEKYHFMQNETKGDGSLRPTTSHADMESALDTHITWAEKLNEAEIKRQIQEAENVAQKPKRRRR